MKKYTLVVLTNAVAGLEEEYNDWYTNHHLTDVLKVPGIKAAQRFQQVGEPISADPLYRYLATYELETDDPKSVLAELTARANTPSMPLSPGLDQRLYCVLYEPISSKMMANG